MNIYSFYHSLVTTHSIARVTNWPSYVDKTAGKFIKFLKNAVYNPTPKRNVQEIRNIYKAEQLMLKWMEDNPLRHDNSIRNLISYNNGIGRVIEGNVDIYTSAMWDLSIPKLMIEPAIFLFENLKLLEECHMDIVQTTLTLYAAWRYRKITGYITYYYYFPTFSEIFFVHLY